MSGTLVYNDYLSLYNNNKIKSLSFKKSQIQPSSIDLSLSEECYEIKTSFLSPDSKVRDKLKKIYTKKISLKTFVQYIQIEPLFMNRSLVITRKY